MVSDGASLTLFCLSKFTVGQGMWAKRIETITLSSYILSEMFQREGKNDSLPLGALSTLGAHTI